MLCQYFCVNDVMYAPVINSMISIKFIDVVASLFLNVLFIDLSIKCIVYPVIIDIAIPKNVHILNGANPIESCAPFIPMYVKIVHVNMTSRLKFFSLNNFFNIFL